MHVSMHALVSLRSLRREVFSESLKSKICCFVTVSVSGQRQFKNSTNNPRNITLCHSRCTLRFPSTNIRLEFQSLVEEGGGNAGGSSGAPMPPLRITIPSDHDGRSPAPSPTGKSSWTKATRSWH